MDIVKRDHDYAKRWGIALWVNVASLQGPYDSNDMIKAPTVF